MSKATMDFATTFFPTEEPLQASPTLNKEAEVLINQVRGFTQKATSTIAQLQGDAIKVKNQLEKALQDAKDLEEKLAMAQCQNEALKEEPKPTTS